MKTKLFFSLAALALMMAACSSDDIATGQSDAKVRTVPFKAVISADAGTRGLSEATDGKTITVDWEKDEQVALVHGLNIDILSVESVDGGNATISGDITDPTDGESVFVVYAGQSSEAMSDFKDILEAYADDQALTAYTEADINLILKNQFVTKVSGGALDGTVESISQLVDQRLGSGALAVSDNGASFKDNVKLTTKYAIWKLSLSDGTNALKAKELTIKNGNTNIAYFKSESGASDFYVPFAPASEASFAFEALVGNDTYTFSKTGVSLAAGTYYRSTLTITVVDTKYLEYDKTGKATEVKPSGATIWTGTVTPGDVAAGTYVVDGTATCDGELFLTGDINLILKDGASLTVNGSIISLGEGAGFDYSMTVFGQAESTGKLSMSESSSYIRVKNLTVHGGVITVSGDGITTEGVITVYHGTINTTSETSSGIISHGGMYVYGGEVTATSTYCAIFGKDSDLTIAGGKVTATSTNDHGMYANNCKVIISGGTVNCNSDGYAISSTTSIEISGGDVTAKSTGENGTGLFAPAITISGNSTKVSASGDAYGIESYVSEGTGTITIEGGDITATAGFTSVTNNGGIGIEASKIKISGGEVKANGGDAKAGSGADGGEGINGSLTVTGGTVTAKGGNGADASEGDGGKGGDGVYGNVSVTGGTVTATGGDGGKGGDGGESHDGGCGGYGVRGTVTGTVTATGGSGGDHGEGGYNGEYGLPTGE